MRFFVKFYLIWFYRFIYTFKLGRKTTFLLNENWKKATQFGVNLMFKSRFGFEFVSNANEFFFFFKLKLNHSY